MRYEIILIAQQFSWKIFCLPPHNTCLSYCLIAGDSAFKQQDNDNEDVMAMIIINATLMLLH